MGKISKTDLARRTREMLERTREGETLVVESYGETYAVLVDPFRYELLQALASLATGKSNMTPLARILRSYLDRAISLGKAAEALQISRFTLMEHFNVLGIPLHIGPETLEAAQEEIENARQYGGE